MKKIICLWIIVSLTTVLFAQKDVTTFLGIPVDGLKSEMRTRLIDKGFTPKFIDKTELLEGEFNGANVHVFIATNNNKVYRIMLADINTLNESEIKIRFNNLVQQFISNKRYITLKNHTLSEEEDISYEMAVHKKIYEARFYQVPNMEKLDSLAIQEKIKEILINKYGKEALDNPTEEIKKEIIDTTANYAFQFMTMKPVWFRINEIFGKYYICMYYDNEYNRANGDDL